MKKINILIICGGESSEHEISLSSSEFLKANLSQIKKFNIIKVKIEKDSSWSDTSTNESRELTKYGLFDGNHNKVSDVDYVIPCIHGRPGETGEIQAFLEILGYPFMGCKTEANVICFNKITSKQWFDSIGIPNTPYTFLSSYSKDQVIKAETMLDKYGELFVKASSQGSSVGCFQVSDIQSLHSSLKEAFKLSPYVLIEKSIKAREIEIAAYEYDGKLKISNAGEIVCPSNNFYSFDEKYSSKSSTTTETIASKIPKDIEAKLRSYSHKVFEHLKLKDLSRIDYFLTEDGNIFLNEINTFPGMTSISMFPKMLEANGDSFEDFLYYLVINAIK